MQNGSALDGAGGGAFLLEGLHKQVNQDAGNDNQRGAGEDHLPAAKRELSEETGLEAEEYTYLGHILASPGFCDESLHMYLARGLKRSAQHPDEDEFLDVVTMPFAELADRVMDGTIADAKTVATVLKVKVLLGL